MKKIAVLAFLMMGVVFGANAQEEKKSNGIYPEITFEKLVHDYGEIPKHGDGKTTFTFTNTGKAPLILSNVRSSCGCTVPSWSREPIMPGQSSGIVVKYNTNSTGPINKSVTVESNAANGRTVLKIKGRVLNTPVNR